MKKVLLLSGKVNKEEVNIYIEVSSPKRVPRTEFFEIFKKLEKAVEGEIGEDGQDSRT